VFLREEKGQDLSEYCMLLALIVLIAAGVFVKVSGGIGSLWASANSALVTSTRPAADGSSADAKRH
jgi:Flp pilus assembly pilin Flp